MFLQEFIYHYMYIYIVAYESDSTLKNTITLKIACGQILAAHICLHNFIF